MVKHNHLMNSGHWSKTMNALGCTVTAQSRNTASALGGTPQYSRLKYIPSKHVLMRIFKGGYRKRNIPSLSGSKATIKALDSSKVNSKLAWDCHQSPQKIAEHNRVQMIWVPGYRRIEGNVTADRLAKTGSAHPFIGPELACNILGRLHSRLTGTGCAENRILEFNTRRKYKMGFLSEPTTNRTAELLKLSTNQSRQRAYFMRWNDYLEFPPNKIMHFFCSLGLFADWIDKGAQKINQMVILHGPKKGPTPSSNT